MPVATKAKASKNGTQAPTAKAAKSEQRVTIKSPKLETIEVPIVGTSPYVQHAFGQKAKQEILAKQTAGGKGRGRKNTTARDLDADYKSAFHVGLDDHYGIPCSALRSAMISACRLVGVTMTKAKLSVFILPDTFDRNTGEPLFHLFGDPERYEAPVRLESGVITIAIRPMWKEWRAVPKIRYDGDQFDASDVCNLLLRAGMQVGIGEGRHDSRKSNGIGFGTFEIEED